MLEGALADLAISADPREELSSPGPGASEDNCCPDWTGRPPLGWDAPPGWKPLEEGPKGGVDPRLRPAKAVGLADPGLDPKRGMLVRAEEWLEGDPPWLASSMAGDTRCRKAKCEACPWDNFTFTCWGARNGNPFGCGMLLMDGLGC